MVAAPSSSSAPVAAQPAAERTAVCGECGVTLAEGTDRDSPRASRQLVLSEKGTSTLVEVCSICCLIHEIGEYWLDSAPDLEQDTVLKLALEEVWSLCRRRLQVDFDAAVARAL